MASMFEEDDYVIPPLSKDPSQFPDPRLAPDEGLLALSLIHISEPTRR